jgi:hypothetical protein
MDSRALWHANFAAQIAALAAKYNISAAVLTQIAADNAWIQYWVQARHDADNLKQQLTKYFNEISGSDPTLDPPAPIVFQLQGAAPAEVPPGIEYRTREIARQIKGMANYASADGELLGIVGGKETGGDLTNLTPEFTLRTLANFELEATFKKQGMDALKFEVRHKGGNWQMGAFLLTSPGTFAVVPAVANTAEQVEVRAIFLQKNNPVGNFSDAKPAFIAP